MNGRQAAELAARGWYVFPCRPDDKRPLAAGWQERATCDPDEVMRTWPGRWCNGGIATGPSRLVVIDLDPPSGATSLHRLRSGRDLPRTYTVMTPRLGSHLYFAAPAGREIACSASKAGPNIDVRGCGGFVVAAGSMVNGCEYVATDQRRPAELPAWLADLADPPRPEVPEPNLLTLPVSPGRDADDRASRYAAGALRRELERIAAAPRGTRNDTLNRSAWSLFRLVADGLLEDAAVTRAVHGAADQCGLVADDGEASVRGTIASARDAGLATPHTRSLP